MPASMEPQPSARGGAYYDREADIGWIETSASDDVLSEKTDGVWSTTMPPLKRSSVWKFGRRVSDCRMTCSAPFPEPVDPDGE
jgi:hypothetical protein